MYKSKKQIRKELVLIGKKIAEKGLIIGPGGNISAKLSTIKGNIIYIKASGKSFEEMSEKDYVGVDLKTGEVIDGNLKPSCELNTHLICYKVREDITAVIHTHPPYSIAYAMLGETLKSFTPDFVAVVGIEVPVADYKPPAGMALAEEIAKYIKNANGVFMKNHGLITVGKTLKEAYYRSLVIEDAVKSLFIARGFGKMIFFTKEQAEEINNMDAENYRRKMMK